MAGGSRRISAFGRRPRRVPAFTYLLTIASSYTTFAVAICQATRAAAILSSLSSAGPEGLLSHRIRRVMPSIVCPSCRALLSVDDALQGSSVACGSCGESVYVAKASPVLITVAGNSATHRRAPKGSLFRIVNACVHIAISLGTAYFGYRLYISRQAAPPPQQVVIRQAPAPRRIIERHAPIPAKPRIDHPRPERLKPADDKPKAPPLPAKPSLELPAFVALPPLDRKAVSQLVELPDSTEISLLPQSPSLLLDGVSVKSDGDLIAGMRVEAGWLEFRWTEPTPESAAALANSVICLSIDGSKYFLSLRAPEYAEAPALDLEKTRIRINGKCATPPPVAETRIAFTGLSSLPSYTLEGVDPVTMKAGDEALLHYKNGSDAATRITVRKSGAMLVADIETRCRLPSSDFFVMSIRHGNSKLKKLTNLFADAEAAVANISRLRAYVRSVESDLSRARNINTFGTVNGVRVQNPVLVAQKSALINRLERELVGAQNDVTDAEQLIRDKPLIEQDLAAVRLAAELAQSLHETKALGYRIFSIVGEQQVTLIEGEYPSSNGPNTNAIAVPEKSPTNAPPTRIAKSPTSSLPETSLPMQRKSDYEIESLTLAEGDDVGNSREFKWVLRVKNKLNRVLVGRATIQLLDENSLVVHTHKIPKVLLQANEVAEVSDTILIALPDADRVKEASAALDMRGGF